MDREQDNRSGRGRGCHRAEKTLSVTFNPTFGAVSGPKPPPFQENNLQSCFHLAYHVTDLDEARAFYGGLLGCREGRSTDTWVDFDFFGHQISLHKGTPFETTNTGKVGDHMVPMPHLGVILDMESWTALAQKLTQAGIDFVIPPTVRFTGEPGEQSTMFFRDPSGNPIEVKGFADTSGIFAS